MLENSFEVDINDTKLDLTCLYPDLVRANNGPNFSISRIIDKEIKKLNEIVIQDRIWNSRQNTRMTKA